MEIYMADEITNNSVLVGAAGEHYVLAELIKRGFIASKAPEGAPNMDILVADKSGQHLCSLQVKTRRNVGNDMGWHMSAKHDYLESENLFYIFVDVGNKTEDLIQYHVMPSKEVATATRVSHAIWLEKPGRAQAVHNDSKMRRLRSNYADLAWSGLTKPQKEWLIEHQAGWLGKFSNAWHLLPLHPVQP